MADPEHTTTPGKSPAFQFYVKEFLSDANQAGMSLQETGAYIRLMCYEWNEQGKGIPDDAMRAARMVGATSAQMRKMWTALRGCFQTHATTPHRIIHPRLELERKKQSAFHRRQSDNGKKGGRPRKPVETQPKPTANPNKSSPISYLQTAVKKIATDDPRDGIAADFLEQYPALYARVRHGARYAVSRIAMERDLEYARALAEGWPDVGRLLAMAEVFLRAEIGDKNRPGTVGQFLHYAPECDGLLRKNGR